MDPAILKALFFIALAIVGYVVNRKKEDAGASGQKARPVDSFPGSAGRPAASPASGDTDQTEKMRKFFEALGLPKTDIPPAPVAPKPAAPPPIPPPQQKPKQSKQTKPRLEAPPPVPAASRSAPPPPLPRYEEAPDSWDDSGRPVRSSRDALGADLNPALREVDPRFDREAVAGAVRGASKQARAEFAAVSGQITRAGDVTPTGRGAVAVGRGTMIAGTSAASLARQLVAHPEALQRAMILQEVLGKPLALRDPAAPRG